MSNEAIIYNKSVLIRESDREYLIKNRRMIDMKKLFNRIYRFENHFRYCNNSFEKGWSFSSHHITGKDGRVFF